MSFLNPVNEPVLRFSSTDAGAPQINYNARTAGDVKTVLKACLVTGYGAKAGAGWTAVNETATVIEFVSPSAAMSDYRLGIDDTSASSTTWYYQYQDARVNPANSQPKKNMSYINKTSASNGWELYVTGRGIFFIEIMLNIAVNTQVARATYFGQVKSALPAQNGENIAFFSVGYGSPIGYPSYFFKLKSEYPQHFRLLSYKDISLFGAASNIAGNFSAPTDGILDIADNAWLQSNDNVCGQCVGFLVKAMSTQTYGVLDVEYDGVNYRHVCLGLETDTETTMGRYARCILITKDNWGY